MRCLACGAEMEVVGVAGGDPEGEPILVSGFERRTHKCLSCGATEQRLVFSREDSGAANSLSPGPSSEPTDSTKQEDAARLAEQFHEPIDSDRQEAAPRPPEPFSVAPADTVEHTDAAPPPRSTAVSADAREHDEAPSTWARSLERIQQRITVSRRGICARARGQSEPTSAQKEDRKWPGGSRPARSGPDHGERGCAYSTSTGIVTDLSHRDAS